MILYLTSQQHTNLLDFLTEQTDALPIKKMTGIYSKISQYHICTRESLSCREGNP